MKQSKTTLKELTAAYRAVLRHGILCNAIALGLVAMPAMAYEITTDTNLNEIFTDGVVAEEGKAINSTNEDGYTSSLTTETIDITATGSVGRGLDAWWGSNVTLGNAETTKTVKIFGEQRGLSIFDPDTIVNVNASDKIEISGGIVGATVVDAAELNVGANIVSVSADQLALVATNSGSTINVGTTTNGDSISLSGMVVPAGEDKADAVIEAVNGAQINIGNGTQDIAISGKEDMSVWALKGGSYINIKGKDITISSENGSGIWAQNNTTVSTDPIATIDIEGDNISISALKSNAVVAMSQGKINLKGNTTLAGVNAILTRGNAQTYINNSGDKTVKMDGDIAFDYNEGTSKTAIDAIVNVTLNGAQSYWNGNTVVSYDQKPSEEKLQVSNTTINLKNGAIWNATKIVDNTADENGTYYTALNNLNIDKGTVNIADAKRGIVVENVNVADATFNGGPLNIGTMNLTGGESVFNTNIIGLNDESSLDVKSGASMDIGTNSINVNTITLNGDMFATLRDGDDAQITTSKFDGNGKLNLTMSKAGKYHVFGKKDFENILSANAVYELSALDDGYIEATVKSAEAIAGDTHIAHESAAAVSHIASAASVSESKQLQELSLKLQERLANGDTASVEHATKAVHPETESVAQSVSSSVQNTVVNAAAARMAMPAIGRSAGDVNLTSGGVWAQGLFNKSKQNDAFHGYTRGIAAGLDGTINKVWTIGAGYSFAHSDITGSARDTEIDSNTLFLYGQYKPSEWYLNAIANYTWSDYSEKGSVIDGALVSADYDVQSFGGHIATGYDFDNGITPELGLRYMHVNADDYTNSYGIKTSMKDTDFLTGVVGAKYAFNIVAGKHTTFAPQLSANAKYDLLSDKSVATITMPGVNAYSLDGNRLNRFGGEFGIGLGMTYDNLHMSINYDIDVRKDYTSQTGMLKFRYNF